MSTWNTIVRVMAVVLLLLTGTELFACELISPATCELAGGSQNSGPSQPTSGDDCLCCCRHVVVTPQLIFVPTEVAIELASPAEGQQLSAFTLNVYRPPRA